MNSDQQASPRRPACAPSRALLPQATMTERTRPMNLSRWFRKLRDRSFTRPDRRRMPHPVRLNVEPLENRTVLNAGALDTTFGPGGSAFIDVLISGEDEARGLAIVQADQKILVVGSSSGHIAVVRYNSDG